MNHAEFLLLQELLESRKDDGYTKKEDVVVLEVLMDLLPRDRVPRARDYFEAEVPEMSEKDFSDNFRLSRNFFQQVLEKLEGDAALHEMNPFGKPSVSLDKQLAMTLHFLGTAECTFHDLCNLFGVSKSTWHKIIRRVCRSLRALTPGVMKWPTTGEVPGMMQKFAARHFPNVVGAVDGTHIAIKPPLDRQDAYANHLKYHSMLLQVICDADMFFLDCYTGWPGSVHDTRVFRNSPVYLSPQLDYS